MRNIYKNIWLYHSKIFFFEWKKWLTQLCYHIFNSILYSSTATKGNKEIFLFFNYEATGPPGAGLQGMYVFIIGRRVDAGFYTWLNWSFLSDLSALVQLHCGSWMFHGKVGWFWALPSSVCFLTETHLLWGRVEVKNSGHDKQRTPGATSDMQPPHPQPFGSQKSGLHVRAERRAIMRTNFYFWLCLSRRHVLFSCFISSGCGF